MPRYRLEKDRGKLHVEVMKSRRKTGVGTRSKLSGAALITRFQLLSRKGISELEYLAARYRVV